MRSRELAWSWVVLAVTLVIVGVATSYYSQLLLAGDSHHSRFEVLGFLVTIPLVYGNLVYQLSRLGALLRERTFVPESRAELYDVYDRPTPAVAVLIPSYLEEPEVLKQTVLSAALAEYPGRRIVVLVDDPPHNRVARQRTLQAVCDVREFLAAPSARLSVEYADFIARQRRGACDLAAEADNISRLYDFVAQHLEQYATAVESERAQTASAGDAFFVERILRAPAVAHREYAALVRTAPLSGHELRREYARLASLLTVDLQAFERKQYKNLSHAPNKAMNLNAYLGLLGGSFRVDEQNGAATLSACTDDDCDFAVPHADFVLTLDADSMIMSDYIMRLMKVMQSDATAAVVQTPYSAYPGAVGALERTAGATTDIQYIAHQGSSRFDAAYWVGANALLRVQALEDIRTDAIERGFDVPIYIQDRTVIEDTGSTIDLIRNGWRVHNYPQRLAYSATPPDFGSLIIQRRRWSNGGLIILPDLLRHCIAAWPSRGVLSEAMMRVHYLLSPALGSVGMLLLMLIPFDPLVSSTQQTASSIWLPLLAAPYFLLYGRDLVRSGYEWRDLGRVYALNLILLPVQLAGVLLSVRQILTGTKAPFGRTPKVEDRTAMAPIYPLFNIVMFAVVLVFALYSLLHGNYFQAGLWTFNVVAYAYAFGAMIGVAAACEDIRTGVGERLKGLRQSDWVGAASLGQIAKSLRRRKHAREQLALARARGSQD